MKEIESIETFPTFAYEEGESWVGRIRGRAYGPFISSRFNQRVERVMRNLLSLDSFDKASEEIRKFDKMKSIFLSKPIEDVSFRIQMLNQEFRTRPTNRLGDFKLNFKFPQSPEISFGWHNYKLTLDDSAEFSSKGKVNFIPPTGLSVISDIDDTLKKTGVADKMELLKNTFIRRHRAYPGLIDVFKELEKHGASFHYVSASPWQLHGPLTEFMSRTGIPKGTMHLKRMQLDDRTVFNLFSSPRRMKLRIIDSIIQKLREREFILVGDSSEKDPEVFSEIDSRHPKRVKEIWIRNVNRESLYSDRFLRLLERSQKKKWILFEEEDVLKSRLENIL